MVDLGERKPDLGIPHGEAAHRPFATPVATLYEW